MEITERSVKSCRHVCEDHRAQNQVHVEAQVKIMERSVKFMKKRK